MAKADRLLLFVIVMAVFANFGLAIFNGLMGHLELLFLNLLGVAVPLAVLYGSQYHVHRRGSQRTGRGTLGRPTGAARLAAFVAAGGAIPTGASPPRPSGGPALVAGPIVAYRTWKIQMDFVHDGHGGNIVVSAALYSLNDIGPWSNTEPTEAACLSSDRISSHPSPDWTCSCGIYALTNLDEAWYSAQGFFPVVCGRVKLYGRVIRHERGYRAQYAQIDALYYEGSPDQWLREVATRYHVPLINVRQ